MGRDRPDNESFHLGGPIPVRRADVEWRHSLSAEAVHRHHSPAGLLWGLKAETRYFGLRENKHTTLLLTSGAFAPHFPSPAFGVDHHSTYMRQWLN
jgi:hypothetical protein